MENSVLKSDYEEIEQVSEKTLPEYHLKKAKYYADQGKDYWLVKTQKTQQ